MWGQAPNSSTLPSALNTRDPDDLFQCPYDPHHRVRACRFSRHLEKCKKIHGDKQLLQCPYNGSHHIPKEEYQQHLLTCDDKNIIAQDIELEMGITPQIAKPEMVTKVCFHQGEDWDEEAEDKVEDQSDDWVNMDVYEPKEDENIEDDGRDELFLNEVWNEELLQEKPSNWESMTPAQKKNYRRRYKRQQERFEAAGIVLEEKSRDPVDWTEKEREDKINGIISMCGLNTHKLNSQFKDYKSLLNHVCQKMKYNPPIYKACGPPTTYGGFGAECVVQSEAYRSREYQRTKQGAEHNAAKWALLTMHVYLESEIKMVHNVRFDPKKRREFDERRRLQEAQPQVVKRLRQPGMASPYANTRHPETNHQYMKQNYGYAKPEIKEEVNDYSPNDNVASSSRNMYTELASLKFMEDQDSHRKVGVTPDDDWQTVPHKKPAGVRGIGRGTGLGRGRGRGTWS